MWKEKNELVGSRQADSNSASRALNMQIDRRQHVGGDNWSLHTIAGGCVYP